MDAIKRWASSSAGNGTFDPQSTEYPDFSLKFEDAIFTIGPSALLLLLTPIYARHYASLPVVTAKEPLIFAKMACSCALVVLQVAFAILYSAPEASTTLIKASSALGCLAALSLAIFLYLEHRHALESSPLPALYLFVTFFLDVARARSYFLRSAIGLYPLGCITAAAAGTRIVLLVLGELPRQYRVGKKTLGPETIQGFWGRTFFIWLNSTLFLGFRNILDVDQLPDLDLSFGTRRLACAFEPIWFQRKSSPLKLLLATWYTNAWSFFSVIPPRILYTGFSFAEPFLIRRILEEVGLKGRNYAVERGLIGAVALVRCGVTLSQVWYKRMNNRLATKTRGTLSSQIVRKSLLLDRHEAKRASSVSLMNTDINGIVSTLPLIHETWANVLELGISIYSLSTVVGKSAFLVILPATIATGIALEVGRRTIPATKVWNDQVEYRVSQTSQVLSEMRGIKMIAAEQPVTTYVQELREVEVGHSKRVRKLSILTNIALSIGYSLTPVLLVAGGIFWDGFNTFNAVNAFTTLAFVYLASRPILSILHSWSRIGGLFACFTRLQAYLMLPERVDGRLASQEGDEGKSENLQDGQQFPLQLVNAAVFSADGRHLFTISAVFERSTVTMVIGPTAVGKSTLLRTLLGETSNVNGIVYVRAQQIAYCDEEEWILNISICDNIIGENAYDEELYNRVVEACLLQEIEKFPDGHQTLAGSRGSNLSGGQRQRIVLARAAYSRAPVFILDDAFSAIDRKSAVRILKNLVGPDGLLRNFGSTVIMATHSVEFLKSADRVMVIHSDGVVGIKSPESAVKEYEGKSFLGADYDDEDISDGDRSEESSSEKNSDGKGSSKEGSSKEGSIEEGSSEESSSEGDNSEDDASDRSPTRHFTPPQPKEKAITDLRQTGDTKLYTYYFRSVRRRVLWQWLVAAGLVTLTEKMPDVYVRLWVEKDPDNSTLFIGYALIPVVGMVAITLWTWIYYVHLIPESAESLHRKLLTTIQQFSQDMSLIMQELPMAFLYFSYNLLGMIANIGIVASAAKYAATLLPFIFPILYGIQLFYLRTSRQIRLLDVESKAPISTYLTETSEGIHHIRAFGWEQQFLAKGQKLIDHSQKPFYSMYCIQRWLGLVLDLTVTAIAVILVALAFNLRSTSQAALGLGLLKIMEIGPDLAILMGLWVDLETSLGAVSRVRSFEEETPREGALDGAGADGTAEVDEHWPHGGEIELENVTAYYTTDGKDYKALDGVSVLVAPGTKVGLVGMSGSGKSSLLLTMLNLLKFSGSIQIDGVDIRLIPRHLLRSRITTISQELMKLPGSVRDNLAPQDIMAERDDTARDATLLAALGKVGLKEVIERRGGLDKILDEIGLSAGEQQLFALARALVHHGRTNSKVIFVDEATSHVDIHCEEKLQEVMKEAFQDCTVITIAHRWETINNTTLLELSAGRLVSYG